VFLFLRDPPLAERPAGADSSAWRDLKAIMALRPLWLLLPLTFTAYAVLAAERSLWVGPYLLEVHRLDPIARGNGILAMSIAMSAGAFAYGPAERLLGSPKLTVLLGSLVTAAAFAVLGFVPEPSTLAAVAALSVIGGFGLTYGILMTHAKLFFPEHLLGRGVTAMNFVFIAGAGLVQAASGLAMNAASRGGIAPPAAFAHLHLGFAAMLLLAAAIYAAAPGRPARRSA
jgi:hypothetical protein